MVWRSFMAPLAAMLVLMPALVSSAQAQRPDRRDDWELLGRKEVGFGVDRDVIRVGRREGRFEKIALEVGGNDVEILDLKVFFNRGAPQDVRVRQFINAGGRTRPIDLQGGDRLIDRIELVYRARPGARGRAVVSVFGLQAAPPPPPPPPRADWVELGRKEVGFRVDRDVIRVGRREGRFDKIALEVSDRDVEIRDLKVFFRHGPPQDVQVRQFIRAGDRTRAIDLIGDDRVIDRIELVYRSRGPGRDRAVVTVYGLQAGLPPPPPRARWEELGCQKVGFGADRDVIKVGRREGRFSAIRLRVERSDVLILNLKVVYERGPVDEFDVKKRIPAGGETPPLDLRGERRAIKQVDLLYTSIPSFKGSARLCVDGRN